MLFFTVFFALCAAYDAAYLYHTVRTKQLLPSLLAALLAASAAAAYIITVR